MSSDIENILSLPHDTWGFLDWGTGILRINVTYDEFTKIEGLPPYERAGFEETITHEMFHRCQICTASYLYNFAIRITKMVIPLIYPYLQNLVQQIEQAPHSGGVTIVGHKEIWEPIAKGMSSPPETLVKFLKEIDELGDDGLSIRSIVESYTYLVQKRIHIENLSTQRYLNLLSYTPSPEYSSAYLFAESILGRDTFRVFEAISFISLCFAKPHVVFRKLCEQFKALKVVSLNDKGKEKVSRIIDNLRQEHFFLGTTLDYINNYPKNIHPYYKRTLKKISNLSIKRNLSIIELMSKPQDWLGDFRKLDGSPIILNPDQIMIINSAKPKRKQSTDEHVEVLNTSFAFVYSMALMKHNNLGFQYIKLRK